MHVLILGGGGRESAFAWKIAQSPLLSGLYLAPGNPGTAKYGANVDLDILDFEGVKSFCKANEISMIVVGPEAPLVAGIYDFFKDSGIEVIGPSRTGAKLEGSKAFAKAFMERHNIPTAGYLEVTKENLSEGIAHIDNQKGPYVLKADGLAAGKGVLIIEDADEAKKELQAMIHGMFGEASSKDVIEDFLKGTEFSVFVLTDGLHYGILPVAKDYKRIGEGDTGPKPGGMGAVSPVPFVDEALMPKVHQRIVKPTIYGLQEEGIEYKGFVFLGLIEVGGEPFVIEYNCRMGDPETEVVLPRLENDLLTLLVAVSEGTLDEHEIIESDNAAATIMLVSGGYPGSYTKGKAITGLESIQDSILFHAGTAIQQGHLVTNGGRVLAVTSYGQNHKEAAKKSFQSITNIDFEGMYYRKDIGQDV